jgi:pimeloyl-ACP methyl ester carboxylesterase
MGMRLGMRVDFKTGASGLTATIDIPEQRATGLSLKNVRFDAPKVHFELPAGPGLAVFDGELKNEEISGTFTQGPATGTFSLKRGTSTPEKPVPEEPVPYKQEEISFSNGQVSLAGTLTLPPQGGSHSAVVMITGSGPQNRDEELFGFKPFRVIADHLTRNGIAVLRYDDRGVGGSTGSTAQSTTEDFAADVLAAVQLLKSRPDIDAKHIGLCGHSEGGIVAPIAAARSSDIAFIILMSGSAVTGERILLAQGEAIARAEGAKEEDLRKQADHQKRIFKAVREGRGWDELRTDMRREGLAQIDKLPAAQRDTISDPGAYIDKVVDGQLKMPQSPWFKYFLDFDPASVLEKVRCPVLAVYGELDLQVPATMNQTALVAALSKSGNKDYTVKVFSKANHLYQEAVTGSPKEYPGLKKEFVPGFLDLLTHWIQEKAGAVTASANHETD